MKGLADIIQRSIACLNPQVTLFYQRTRVHRLVKLETRKFGGPPPIQLGCLLNFYSALIARPQQAASPSNVLQWSYDAVRYEQRAGMTNALSYFLPTFVPPAKSPHPLSPSPKKPDSFILKPASKLDEHPHQPSTALSAVLHSAPDPTASPFSSYLNQQGISTLHIQTSRGETTMRLAPPNPTPILFSSP